MLFLLGSSFSKRKFSAQICPYCSSIRVNEILYWLWPVFSTSLQYYRYVFVHVHIISFSGALYEHWITNCESQRLINKQFTHFMFDSVFRFCVSIPLCVSHVCALARYLFISRICACGGSTRRIEWFIPSWLWLYLCIHISLFNLLFIVDYIFVFFKKVLKNPFLEHCRFPLRTPKQRHVFLVHLNAIQNIRRTQFFLNRSNVIRQQFSSLALFSTNFFFHSHFNWTAIEFHR